MTDRAHARVVVLAALVMSLVLTLAARAFSLQVADPADASAQAADNRLRELVTPATRGIILDQLGRPLAANRLALDVAVSRRALRALDDDGAAVLVRLSRLLGVASDTLAARLVNCGTPGARPQPDCWNGAPGADPVVARDLDATRAAAILARPGDYSGVTVSRSAVREYPGHDLAAHALGYVGAVTADELAQDPGLTGVSGTGKAGLELQYDAALRGSPGSERVTVDSAGHRIAAMVADPATPGRTLVTNLDARLQQVVQEQLQAAIERARGRIDPVSHRPYEADGGAAVVLDVRTGAVLALASAPTYDANLWTGGISAADYAGLTDQGAGQPLLDRSLHAALAPASTFKVVSSAAALRAGYSRNDAIACPSSYRTGGRSFRNYESKAHGFITLARSLEVSCDTVFYRVAHDLWTRDGGSHPVPDPEDLIGTTAAQFGFGRPTGIDLPGESAGRLASRQEKAAQWDAHHEQWCRSAEQGYPEVTDPEHAHYLTRLAAENCTDGMLWRVGDAMNAAIGQGDTVATVLQVAGAYAAIANGGTLWQPHVAKALLNPDGSVAERFEPTATGSLAASAADLAYLRGALRGVVERGTARKPFAGFPVGEVPVAAKTGTGEVYGKQATSWFASFAPADAPRYAVVLMVAQGGTGAGTSGRSVRAIHEALFGVVDGHADPSRSVLVGGDVAGQLPRLGADGVPVAPASP